MKTIKLHRWARGKQAGRLITIALLTLAVAIVMNSVGLVPFIVGFAYFIVIVARGIEYESDVPFGRALVVAVGALAGLLVANAIFRFSPLI